MAFHFSALAILCGGMNPNTMMMGAMDPSLLTLGPRLDMAENMVQGATDSTPILSPWQGLARDAAGLICDDSHLDA